MSGETIMAFQARASARIAEHDRRLVEPLHRELAKARRSIAILRETLTMERARAREAVAEMERTCDEHAGRSLNARYPVILATMRATKALGL